MKKTSIALAAILTAGSALATSVTPATGSVVGSATSQVGGATSSFSVATMPGQHSAHFSMAAAQNCTTVVGVARPGTNGGFAGTMASTIGRTFTAGGGTGVGATYAGASQFGFGTVTASANIAGDATGLVSASSTVATGTMSTVSTVDGGSGMSGTKAGAFNGSFALAGSSALENGVSVQTGGVTAGKDFVKTFGNASPENATITAMGTLTIGEGEGQVRNVGSFQSGTFSAEITRNFTASPTGVGGPGGCVSGTCEPHNPDTPNDPEKPDHPPKGEKGPKGNNGWGNGAEGTNNGSDDGGTKGSKIDENWKPGDGPKPPKFGTR